MIIVELLSETGKVLSTIAMDETIVKKYEDDIKRDAPLSVSGVRIKIEEEK